jgi:hypothetical protein
MRQNTSFSITESVRALLRERLDKVLGRPFSPRAPIACLDQLRRLLEALPFDTTDFGLASNRLANARHYLESGEYGAARYELRLLRRSLEQ